jgi:hypothetical protein
MQTHDGAHFISEHFFGTCGAPWIKNGNMVPHVAMQSIWFPHSLAYISRSLVHLPSVVMASKAGISQLAAGTQSPWAFFKYPSLQKQPMTQLRVHIGLGTGLAQVAGQAVPQAWNSACSPHFGIGGSIMNDSGWGTIEQSRVATHLPVSERKYPCLQAQPWTQIRGQMGLGFLHVPSHPLHWRYSSLSPHIIGCIGMASAAGTPQVSECTHMPCSFFKNPGLQKHPTTQFFVQTGLGWGLAQVGAQADPQRRNISLSWHWVISGG